MSHTTLQEEGYEFAELPSIEDFELQLERAIESLEETLRMSFLTDLLQTF